MQSQTNRAIDDKSRNLRDMGNVPSAIRESFIGANLRGELQAAAPACLNYRAVHDGAPQWAALRTSKPGVTSAVMFSDIDAGVRAGIFFGRLNRRFDVLPSRRFSGPSAEFISVNGLQTRLRVLRFAPMNNPYRCSSARKARRGERVSLTLVLSHFV